VALPDRNTNNGAKFSAEGFAPDLVNWLQSMVNHVVTAKNKPAVALEDVELYRPDLTVPLTNSKQTNSKQNTSKQNTSKATKSTAGKSKDTKAKAGTSKDTKEKDAKTIKPTKQTTTTTSFLDEENEGEEVFWGGGIGKKFGKKISKLGSGILLSGDSRTAQKIHVKG
jgi:hypothetical protein